MSGEGASARLRILAGLWGSEAEQERLPWEPFREGVELFQIYGDRAQGPAAALLRYAPGARVPRHRHGGWEHILVLRGSQLDDAGEYAAGTLVINAPGSCHAVVSPGGCVVLAIWTDPIELL